MELGKLLREYRKKRGWSQSELINRYNTIHGTSYGKSTLSQYETGKRTPDLETIRNLGTLLLIPMNELLGVPGTGLTEPVTLYEILDREGLTEEDIEKVADLVRSLKERYTIK